MLVAVAAIVLSLALAAVVHQAAITFQGYAGDWALDNNTLLGAALFVLLGVAQGVGFAMLLRNTPAAIVPTSCCRRRGRSSATWSAGSTPPRPGWT